jgi:outer membrane protein
MKTTMNSAVQLLLMAAAVTAAGTASAQSAGQWTVKAGINTITPKVKSGDISAPALPGTKAAVGSDSQPVLVIAYGLSDNISAEVHLGTPYTHELSGDGAIQGVGKLGTVKVLPPTAFVQYRFFSPATMLRPYFGLGLTYAYNMETTGSGQLTAITNAGPTPTTFKVDNKLAAGVQAGLALNFTERWFADVAVSKTFLKTQVHFSSGQQQDITLDPLAVSVAVGYKF